MVNHLQEILFHKRFNRSNYKTKSKGHPATGHSGPKGSGLVRARIFLMFSTTRVAGRQPYALARTGEIPGTHFQRLSRPQGTWFCRGYHGKKSPVTPPGIDPGTVPLVPQCLNHYATPGLNYKTSYI